MALTWIGKLSQNGGLWSGSIRSTLSDEDSGEYKRLLEKSFSKVNAQAPMRCIDGRVGKVHEELGPQISGGGPGFSLAFHVATGLKGVNVIEDFNTFWELHRERKIPFAVGGHVDDHSQPPNSGCGAIDKMPEILARIVDTGSRQALETYTRAILGDSFDQQVFDTVLLDMLSIKPSVYFKEHGHSYRREFIAQIKQHSTKETIERLEGAHREIFVSINKLSGTTLNKEAFVAKTGGEVQAFNYDFWFTKDLAKALFPSDLTLQDNFTTANLLFNLATAMVLTDGSLDVAMR